MSAAIPQLVFTEHQIPALEPLPGFAQCTDTRPSTTKPNVERTTALSHFQMLGGQFVAVVFRDPTQIGGVLQFRAEFPQNATPNDLCPYTRAFGDQCEQQHAARINQFFP